MEEIGQVDSRTAMLGWSLQSTADSRSATFATYLHRRVVDIHVFHSHVRVLGCNGLSNLAPQA